MINVYEELNKYAENEYKEFISKLTPTINKDKFIGVRVTNIRPLAKELIKSGEVNLFLDQLPHNFYEENLLHSICLAKTKNIDELYIRLEEFLPYVDNWAVCDTLRPDLFKKNKDKLMDYIIKWTDSDNTYTVRFGIDMLMSYYLDDDFKKEYLNIPLKIVSEEYYINMMIAWYYATALAKQWDSTIEILENNKLGKWVHNKTIQKAIESFRITDEQKEYLRGLKR